MSSEERSVPQEGLQAEHAGDKKDAGGAEIPEAVQSQNPADGQLEKKLEKARQEAAENYDRLLRVSAEFDNFKKRTTKQMEDLRKFANEDLLKELLNVADNLERAVAAARDNTNAGALLEGVNLTLSEVRKLLERFKVQPIESMGQAFDPNFHQAMMQQESDEHPPNTVIKELQKGYLIHDRLLRPALVVVSKSGSGGEADGGKEANREG